jgi:hypothetical protein
MGSCVAIDETNVVEVPKPNPKRSNPQKASVINTYPSIEDVIHIERLKSKRFKPKRNSKQTDQSHSTTQS